MLEKSVVEKCWREVLFKSVGEDFGEDGCREVLEKRVVEKWGKRLW